MKKIKILHYANMNKGSGVASFLYNYYLNIDKTTYHFDFVSHSILPKNYRDEIKMHGGNLFIISHYKYFLSYIIEFSNIIKNGQYDIIHCHEAILNIIAFFLAYKNNIKTRIAHSHSSSMSSTIKKIIVYCFRPIFKFLCTDFFACSNQAGQFLFGKKTKIVVINNAININNFCFDSSKRKELRASLKFEGRKIIGNVAGFGEGKNHFFLINVIFELIKKDKSFLLVLVGDGKLKKTIFELVKELKLEQYVIFLGVRTDISDLLQSFDFFCFPSLYEGLSVALIEAQTSGLKCVCWEKAIVPETAISNLLVRMDNLEPIEWAEYINNNFTYVRKDMSLETINAGFDISTETKKLEKTYSLLLEKCYE